MILIDQKYKKKSIKGWFKENGFFLCLVALPVLQFLIMYVYVNLNSFVMAFRSYSVDEGWGWAGFDNFNEVFRQFESANLFKHAFNNSLIAFAMMLPFDLVGVFFSYYIFKKFAAWKLFRNILFLPQILSAGVLILMFDNFGDTFICVALENWFGIETGGTLAKNPEYGFYVMIIYNIFMSFGTAVIMYTNAMSNIDESVLEASKLDGASDFVEFFKIVLPQIISVFSVFLTIRIASIFVVNTLCICKDIHCRNEILVYTCRVGNKTYPFTLQLGESILLQYINTCLYSNFSTLCRVFRTAA